MDIVFSGPSWIEDVTAVDALVARLRGTHREMRVSVGGGGPARGLEWLAVSAARAAGVTLVVREPGAPATDSLLVVPAGWKPDREAAKLVAAGAGVEEAPELGLAVAARVDLLRRYGAISPDGDGGTHINVYSRGRTALGRFLSNWSSPSSGGPVETQDGAFRTPEGYWFWLLTSDIAPGREALRELSGWQAKEVGGALRDAYPRHWGTAWEEGGRLTERAFRRRFMWSLLAKLERSSDEAAALGASTAPLLHYYVYGRSGRSPSVVPGEAQWLVEFWEGVRAELDPRA